MGTKRLSAGARRWPYVITILVALAVGSPASAQDTSRLRARDTDSITLPGVLPQGERSSGAAPMDTTPPGDADTARIRAADPDGDGFPGDRLLWPVLLVAVCGAPEPGREP